MDIRKFCTDIGYGVLSDPLYNEGLRTVNDLFDIEDEDVSTIEWQDSQGSQRVGISGFFLKRLRNTVEEYTKQQSELGPAPTVVPTTVLQDAMPAPKKAKAQQQPSKFSSVVLDWTHFMLPEVILAYSSSLLQSRPLDRPSDASWIVHRSWLHLCLFLMNDTPDPNAYKHLGVRLQQ